MEKRLEGQMQIKNEHLLSTYCVPGFLYKVSHLILKVTLQDGYFYFYYSGQGNQCFSKITWPAPSASERALLWYSSGHTAL